MFCHYPALPRGIIVWGPQATLSKLGFSDFTFPSAELDEVNATFITLAFPAVSDIWSFFIMVCLSMDSFW